MSDQTTKELRLEHSDISQFLRLLLQLGGAYIVDAQNYVRTIKNPDQFIQLKIGPSGQEVDRRLMVYSAAIADPEAIVINPFSEGIAEAPERTWFQERLILIESAIVRKMMLFVLRKAAEAKKGECQNEDVLLVRLISPFLEEVDDKSVAEFKKFVDSSLEDFFGIVYIKEEKCSYMRSGLFAPNIRKAYKNIRQKSWTTFEKIYLHLFGVQDPNMLQQQYSAVATTPGCPRFETFIKVWLMVLQALADYLPYLEIEVPFGELEMHIKRIPQYHTMARWLVQPTAMRLPSSPVAGAAAPTQPQPTGGVVVGQPQQPAQAPLPFGVQQPQPLPWLQNRPQGQGCVPPGAVPIGGAAPMGIGIGVATQPQTFVGQPQQYAWVRR